MVNLRITLIGGCFQYAAEAIEESGRYYYRIGSTTVEITKSDYDRVIGNPHLYYFSTALRLHNLLRSRKDAAVVTGVSNIQIVRPVGING